MIYPDAEPIAHVSPYRRIEIGAREWPKVKVEADEPVAVNSVAVQNIWNTVWTAAGGVDVEYCG